MATYKSDKASASAPARYLHAGDVTEFATYTTSAVASSGDVVQMVKVDPGARVVSLVVKSDDTLAYAVGDGIDPNRYFATASVAAGTNNIAMVNLGYEYSAADTIDIAVGTGSALTAQTFQAIVTVAYDGD